MGNKLGRKRQVVDERYTKPQGLYVHKDVDHKKLRKLILESKLAPCFPGDDECCYDAEECPICFLEEQRVIEAKIRIRQQELQDEEERTQKRLDITSSSGRVAAGEVSCGSTTVLSCRPPSESEEITSSQHSIRRPPYSGPNRDDEFDLDLEDIMVMEAIWLSIQENGRQKNLISGDTVSLEQFAREARYTSPAVAPLAGTSSSPSGGLACAIAALAERQQMAGESSVHNNGNMSSYNMLSSCSSSYVQLDHGVENYPPAQSSIDMPPDCRMAVTREDVDWGADSGSEAAEAGTSYASSDSTDDSGGISGLLPPPPPPPPPPDEIGESFHNVPGPIVPESFEEQMMLAMAVSLAEARAVTSLPGSTWQ
ncbi:hypothetical protein Tsubulata_000925 [Turnera subulata]|uniref:Uncharacterized protein n=1 Tax=Turnera subulata TaxID=218843 RepID=A0A9Q0JH48_9ROSI|nr:hypothetical protein Tsubulata_000925 [Turnera subulata]